jgi:hypothetical protein
MASFSDMDWRKSGLRRQLRMCEKGSFDDIVRWQERPHSHPRLEVTTQITGAAKEKNENILLENFVD